MDDPERVSFLGTPCPRSFRLRTVILQPHDALDYQPADWLNTLVLVERGELEVECRSGARASFDAGSALVLSGLELRRLRNPGSTPLVLSALSRSDPSDEHAIDE
jgi:hypothetical protein